MTVKQSTTQSNSSSVNHSSDQNQVSGENIAFIETLYQNYLQDPTSVDASWIPFFEEYFGQPSKTNGHKQYPSFRARSIFEPALVPGASQDKGIYIDSVEGTKVGTPGKTDGFAARVEAMVRGYRIYGHLAAKIDPLGRPLVASRPDELDPATYGFSESDMSALVHFEPVFGEKAVPLRRLIEKLDELYCHHIGIEYQNITSQERRKWLREQIENNYYAELDASDDVKLILQKLIEADAFENFLHKKYVGAKRFSLSGGDSLIPMLTILLEEGGELGVNDVIIGMAHRGRLNVLHNIMNKSAEAMLSEFEKNPNPEDYLGSSDVKYHMGYSNDYVTRTGKEIHLSLCFNPSHLEFVNPVVLGRSRAKQDRRGHDSARQELLPILLHGDAAFAGQGIVAESLNLARVEGFHVGGTIHIVINNQIGFTTLPDDARSTTYATDIAKMMEVPIFHVNGDDPEACARVMKLAARYRQQFGEDVVIDLVCYRRYGHNEGDEPRYTQPEMYRSIDATQSVRESYSQSVIDRQIFSKEEVDKLWEERNDGYSQVFKEVRTAPQRKVISSLDGLWSSYHGGKVGKATPVNTAITREKLTELGEKITYVPDTIKVHRTVRRLLSSRQKMTSGEESIDWGMGEALAFASIADQNFPVRLTGQDVTRGTFSHRHAAVFNMDNGEKWWPINHIREGQAKLQVFNSILSEAAVVGFEYGYSLDYPDALVMWEAQFGDFVNGAQVLIDQFINSGEDKWSRLSGLTMLLPHGYEGQGPEHSSARLERFLQLCAEDNMYVCNFTTPAQYFHALRRQVLQAVRKPLIVMTPKSLLRHRDAVSTIDDFVSGEFQPIIGENRPEIDAKKVDRVILCTGKLYYDLVDFSRQHGITDTAIIRIEQLHPLNTEHLKTQIDRFPKMKHLVWAQEEPKNMGAWSYIFPILVDTFGAQHLPVYAGRAASASPATGAYESHELEQAALIQKAFEGKVSQSAFNSLVASK